MKKRRGKLIVLDGTDGSGKTTQLRLLAQRLRRQGARVAIVDFPQYGKFFGKIIRRLLNGEFGPIHGLYPHVVSVLYAADRWQAKAEIERQLKSGAIVLADRYATANMIHQGGKIPQAAKRRAFIAWLKDLEYRTFGIPRPDLVLFLDMPPAAARKLLSRRRTDRADADQRHQAASYRFAVLLARLERGWRRIRCTEGLQPRTPSAIAEEVWRIVQTSLGR